MVIAMRWILVATLWQYRHLAAYMELALAYRIVMDRIYLELGLQWHIIAKWYDSEDRVSPYMIVVFPIRAAISGLTCKRKSSL